MPCRPTSVDDFLKRPIFITLLFVVIALTYLYRVKVPQRHDSPKSPSIRRLNAVVTEYDRGYAERLRALIVRNATSRDPQLISLIRELVDPPSPHMLKAGRRKGMTPQAKEVARLLKNKRRGFFVECGAYDGELASNTLYLEQVEQWNGLLIEMDPYFYTQLRGKSRRAYSINACLSPTKYPMELEIKESADQRGQLVKAKDKTKKTYPDGPRPRTKRMKVPCFPLESILLALNQTKVDYFSLDVEGFELDVLKAVPFDRLDISVLSVEYIHGRGAKQDYVNFMVKRNYALIKDIHYHERQISLYVDDFIFAKKK